MRTLLFSDLHLGHDRDLDLAPYQWVKEAIDGEKPDLVVWAGDIGDFWRIGPALRDDLIAALREMLAWAPKSVYVLGNHDHFVNLSRKCLPAPRKLAFPQQTARGQALSG